MDIKKKLVSDLYLTPLFCFRDILKYRKFNVERILYEFTTIFFRILLYYTQFVSDKLVPGKCLI